MKNIITILLLNIIFSTNTNATPFSNVHLKFQNQLGELLSLEDISDNNKKVIAIWPFEGDNKFNAIDNLHAIVTDAVRKSGRFDVVERDRLNAVLEELDNQAKVESRNSGNFVDQGRILGANYNMIGDIVSIDISRSDSKNSKTGKVSTSFDCTILISVRIVNVETSLVEKTETISAKNGFISFPVLKTETAAFNKACKKLLSQTEGFIKKAFPKMVSIVEVEIEKKGKAKKILIAGGSNLGLKNKDKLVVYEISELVVKGITKEREKPIAELQISEVQGADFAICKVKKGGKELLEKINSGANLICKTQ